MSKDELSDWDETAANNTDVGGVSIAEGMNPGDVNGAMREIMAQLAANYASNAWRQFAADVPSDDLNSITENGLYDFASSDGNVPVALTGVALHLARSAGRAIQIASPATGSSALGLYFRELSGDGWSAWRDIMHGAAGAADIFHLSADVLTVSATETSAISPGDAEYGVSIGSSGNIVASRSNGTAAIFKRSNDGSLAQWYIGTTLVGSISASSGVVTYGSFCGAHWSQFKSLARPNVLRGTILESIDRLCEWPGETEDVLPQVAIAQPGSRSVYGVFSNWDEGTRDISVASLGAFVVRIAPGAAVRRGDLIEAGPDGCGVVQADDVFRASTVAKITAAVKAETYPDGSYLVPCTLHCG
jgi:hypothetical protein